MNVFNSVMSSIHRDTDRNLFVLRCRKLSEDLLLTATLIIQGRHNGYEITQGSRGDFLFKKQK